MTHWKRILGDYTIIFSTAVLSFLGCAVLGGYGIYELSRWSYGEEASHFTEEKAAQWAMVRLIGFAETHHLKVEDFRGPFFIEHTTSGLGYPVYILVFIHPQYYLLSYDWLGRVDDYLTREGIPDAYHDEIQTFQNQLNSIE